jgi:diguanylate cyclase (GGDEF)-like protein/PAS domain S-box-containing protein
VSSNADPISVIEAETRRQKTALLYRGAGIALSVHVVNASLLAYVNATLYGSAATAFAWWGLVIAAAATRYLLAQRYYAAQPDATAAAPWQRRYIGFTAVLAAAWGSAAYLFMWDAPDSERLFSGLVLSGMVAGAVPLLAPVPAAFRTCALLIGAPLAAVMLLQADSALHWAFGSMAVVFVGAMLASAHYLHETLDASIRLGLEKGGLLDKLERAHRTAEAALEASSLCLWDFDIASGRVYLDENWPRIAGGEAGERVALIADLATLMHPDDHDRMARAAMDTIKGTTPSYREDIRIRSASGEWKWITCRGKVIERDASGWALRAVGTNLDITKRKAAELAMAASEQRYRALFENAPIGIALTTPDGSLIAANEAMSRMFACDRQYLTRINAASLYADPAQREAALALFARNGAVQGYEVRLRRRDGTLFDGSLTANQLDPDQGGILVSMWQDISERKRAQTELQESEARFRDIVDYSPIGMSIASVDGRLVRANRALCAMLGYESGELERATLWQITHADDLAASESHFNELISGKVRRYQVEKRYLRKDGKPVWVQLTSSLLRQVGDAPPLVLGQVEDITERRQRRDAMYHQANYDPLTDLPNRRLLIERVNLALADVHNRDRSVAVLYLDLDRFKEINDTLGHDVGDELLNEVASRLKTCVRRGDTVSRLGGDEFVIVLTDLELPQDASLVARKILEALGEAISIQGNRLTVTTSIGISLYPNDGTEDGDELIKNADAAMYAAKRGGRNRYCYHREIRDRVVLAASRSGGE